MFFRFLLREVCGSLKLLLALMGLSWPLLEPIWSQNGGQTTPKTCQTKLIQKSIPKRHQYRARNGPSMDPKTGPRQPQDVAKRIPSILFESFGNSWDLLGLSWSHFGSLGAVLGCLRAVLGLSRTTQMGQDAPT